MVLGQSVNELIQVEETGLNPASAPFESVYTHIVERSPSICMVAERAIRDQSIFELVDLPESSDKASEIRRRISLTSLPNQLAFQFLSIDKDDEKGFVSVLNRLQDLTLDKLKRADIHWVLGQPGDENKRSTVADRVVTATCVRLLGFRNSDHHRQAILCALRGRFDSLVDEIVEEIRDDVVAYKRKVRNGTLPSAKKSSSLSFNIGSDETGKSQTLGDTIGLGKPRCALGSISAWEEAIEFANYNRGGFIRIFGESVWGTFEIFLSYAVDERVEPGTRKAEAALTRLLAQRGVSRQQARADKRKFRMAMSQALLANNPLVVEFVEKLKAGGQSILDDPTFVKGRNS